MHLQYALENEQDIAADLASTGKVNHVHHHATITVASTSMVLAPAAPERKWSYDL